MRSPGLFWPSVTVTAYEAGEKAGACWLSVVTDTTTWAEEVRKHGLFPSLSLLKKPRYYANFVLREFTTTPVFADHQFVFSS